ncbi:MAG: 23S rRNA methyltransferase [Clostridiales bacterium 38_11]|nr:MAG: 23S rRNA methyltransferase [Clostridiales bacterium 38_11]HBH12722.1 RNA methyltransferase [Clostridiales bacterium]
MLLSNDNFKIKTARALLTKKGRDQLGKFLAEGETLVKEYLAFSDCIEYILISENAAHNIGDMAPYNHYLVKESVFNTISSTRNSQGIVAIVRKKTYNMAEITQNSLLFFADSIQDPGNMGTIIRSCDAFGAKSLIYNKGCVDIYNPKTIRASMGSLNRLSHIKTDNNPEILKTLIDKGFTVFSAVVDSDVYLESIKACQKAVIVVGNESRGIDKEIINSSDISFSIRMRGSIESLNVGVAASICLYHFGMTTSHSTI